MEDDRIRQPHNKQEEGADGRPWRDILALLIVWWSCVMNMTWRRTDYSTNLSNAIDLISHIGADGDGHILLGSSHR